MQGLFTKFIETFTVVITGSTLFSVALVKHIECQGGRAISRTIFSEYDLRKNLTKPCTVQNLAKLTKSVLSIGEENLCGLIALIIRNLSEREPCLYGYFKTKRRKT